ncbi:EEF1AKMT4-ECE2 readthrough transcript protein [Araneus ventricosus]|uniref:EEF1AKMT4-ECE2 readthrough transcript protein n=1 Tax=Araneus ventricosus TaxID=182803 RepID=A0A4Y2FR10_ARAVE|nr:EEF1AKMT4-ECE2 readthrough transcript protein [Araneus ventricosus]
MSGSDSTPSHLSDIQESSCMSDIQEDSCMSDVASASCKNWQPSTSPAPGGNKIPYIIAFVAIILVTSVTLIVFHSVLGYQHLTERTLSLQRSNAEKFRKYECDKRLCNSKECVSMASRIMQLMNTDIDPCIDFYEYSCGGYAKSIDVPNGHTPEMETRLNLMFDIRKVMEISSNNNESQTTRKMKEFYQSCMNSEQRSIQQKLSLDRWFSEIELALDGFHSEYEMESATHRSWNALVSRLEEYQIHTIVKPYFKSSRRSPIEKIEIDCTIPFFAPKVYLNATADDNYYLLSLYKNYIKDALKLLPMKDATKRGKFSEDVIKIETDVATAIKNSEVPPNPMITSENTLLLKDLWRTIIGDAIQEIEVQSICKYDLDSILTTLRNAEPEKATNYVIWRMLSQIIPYLGSDYRKLYLRHMSELPGRGNAFESKWQECSDLIRDEFGLAAFKALLDSGFFDVRLIQETKDAFLEVKKNFLLTFQSIEWARGIIKKLFLEKIQKMKIDLSIPDTITQPNVLDDAFRDLELEDNFLLSVMNVKKFKTRYFFTRLWYGNSENAVSKISLEDNPLSGTSRYDYAKNTVHIGIGLLYPPVFLYSGNIPKYLQFGEYSLLAREMTHAFDATGKKQMSFNYGW